MRGAGTLSPHSQTRRAHPSFCTSQQVSSAEHHTNITPKAVFYTTLSSVKGNPPREWPHFLHFLFPLSSGELKNLGGGGGELLKNEILEV